MESRPKQRHFSPILFALVLASMLILAACTGAQAETELEAQANLEAQAEAQAEIGNPDDLYTDQAGTEADASVEAEAQAEAAVEAEAVPELVLGSPNMRSSEPTSFQRASGQIQFLEFFAYWCPTCKALAPSVHGLEDIYGEQVTFVYLDIDDAANANAKQEFGFYYQPHIFLLGPNGEILGEWVGGADPADLQAAIELALD